MQRHVPDHRRCSAPPPPPQALRPWPPFSSPWPHQCHRGTGPPSAIAAPGAKGRRWGCGGGGGVPVSGGASGRIAGIAGARGGAGGNATVAGRGGGGLPRALQAPPPRQMHRSRHKRLFRDIAIRTVRRETKGYPDGNGLGARSPIIRNRGKRRAGVDGCHASALTA